MAMAETWPCFFALAGLAVSATAQIEAVWLTSRCGTPEKTVVSWKSASSGPSHVCYGADAACGAEAWDAGSDVVHRVEIPTLGNHDKQIGERGVTRPASGAAVYDVDATAYLRMFALPGVGWRWAFSIPQADAVFFSLDIEHVSDLGTGWQTCHDYRAGSEQYRWYDEQTERCKAGFVVTLLNERSSCRGLEKGAWGRLFERGTQAITGFGYFAERAVERGGFPYYGARKERF